MLGADNQQERLCIEAISSLLGSFLAGFALGEASFRVVCRFRAAARRGWRILAACNVSQTDRALLDLFRETLACGSMRRADNGRWYWEVNYLSDLSDRIVPFVERLPLVGLKAEDVALFRSVVAILSQGVLSDLDFHTVLALRKRMNRGGKRRYSMKRILRDYTPGLPVERPVG